MARIKKRSLKERHIQPRGWGYEIWVENVPEYCGKILVIDPGKRGSLHFHVNKKETMLVTKGTMHLRLIDTLHPTAEEYVEILTVDDSILIPQHQPHQIINASVTEQLILVEFSTVHEETDSKRLQKGD